MTDDDVQRAARQRHRLMSRWRTDEVDAGIVETQDGELHVATTGFPEVAEHIVTLHNRTFGDGQDPDPRTEAFRHVIAGVQMADEAPLAWQHPPATAVGQYLRRLGAPAYVAEMADVVEQEVQRRVTEVVAREPARVSVAENPGMMARLLRDLGYFVAEPGHNITAPPTVKLKHAGPDNGVQLEINGEIATAVNDGDSGGAGLTLGVRALAGALHIQWLEEGLEQ